MILLSFSGATNESLTAGQIIGILIGITLLGIIIAAAVYVTLRMRKTATYSTNSEGFSNALYSKSVENVSISDDNHSISSQSRIVRWRCSRICIKIVEKNSNMYHALNMYVSYHFIYLCWDKNPIMLFVCKDTLWHELHDGTPDHFIFWISSFGVGNNCNIKAHFISSKRISCRTFN